MILRRPPERNGQACDCRFHRRALPGDANCISRARADQAMRVARTATALPSHFLP